MTMSFHSLPTVFRGAHIFPHSTFWLAFFCKHHQLLSTKMLCEWIFFYAILIKISDSIKVFKGPCWWSAENRIRMTMFVSKFSYRAILQRAPRGLTFRRDGWWTLANSRNFSQRNSDGKTIVSLPMIHQWLLRHILILIAVTTMNRSFSWILIVLSRTHTMMLAVQLAGIHS